MAIHSLIGVSRTTGEQMAEIVCGSQIQVVIWVRFYNFIGSADWNHEQLAHLLINWRETLALFRSRERYGVIGAHKFSGD